MLTFALIFALAVVVSPWTLYPLALKLLGPAPVRRDLLDADQHRLSVLIPAFNEAESLPEKLRTTLAAIGHLPDAEILVGDDGSTDATAAIVRRAGDPRVRLISQNPRQGKAAMLNKLLDHAEGDLVLLTDASVLLDRAVVERLMHEIAQPGVGAVVPRYTVSSSQNGEDGYWSLETQIKHLAAQKDALLGAHGAAWLARRNALGRLPVDTINDDFVLPMFLRIDGWRITYCMDVAVVDEPTNDLGDHYRRWARIAQGNVQMLMRYRHWMHPRHGRVALSLVLHKAAKTALPLAFAVAVVATCLLAAPHLDVRNQVLPICALTLSVVALGARARLGKGKLGRMIALCVTAVTAYAVGSLRALRKQDGVLWARGPVVRHRSTAVLVAPTLVPTLPRLVLQLKRVFDVVVAGIGLVCAAPIMAIVALAVRLDSKGPAFYRQERLATVGANGRGKTFWMLKFRTMRSDAETASGPVWASEEDPRITRVGRILRKCRLDEVPQLINVFVGEMSMVGPRPERPFFTRQLQSQIPAYHDRLLGGMKPGITGWAQIHCPYDTSVESVNNKLLYDLAYAAHLHQPSTWFRMEIITLLKTVKVALTGKGAR